MLLAPEYVIHKRVRVPLGFDYGDTMARLGYRIDKIAVFNHPRAPEYDLGGHQDLNDKDFLDLCCLERSMGGEEIYQEFEKFMFHQADDVEGEDYEIQTIPITLDFNFQVANKTRVANFPSY